jgi:CRP/FNR family transcriptional regulator, cyclic AMP receptor protein
VDRSRLVPLTALEGIPGEELDAVARHATEREFADGDTMMAQGDFGYSLFLVESGSADVVAQGEKVAEVGPGDIVGETAVMEGRRTASVVATSPVRAIALFKRDVWALDRRAPVATQRLRAMVGEHRAEDAQRALAKQRAQDEQGGSPGTDPHAGSA